jgi:hypothetical protein
MRPFVFYYKNKMLILSILLLYRKFFQTKLAAAQKEFAHAAHFYNVNFEKTCY